MDCNTAPQRYAGLGKKVIFSYSDPITIQDATTHGNGAEGSPWILPPARRGSSKFREAAEKGGADVAIFRYIVTDVNQAVTFYTSSFDFRLEQSFAPTMAILRREDLELWTAGPEAAASKAMPDGAKPVSGGWSRIVIPVKDLAETVLKLRGDGVKFRNEIVVGPNGRQILCEDPSGNPIELFQYS